MEELCEHPHLPEVVDEKQYLCLFGPQLKIEHFLSEKFSSELISIKTGLTFYRYQKTLVVTCVTDKLNPIEKANFLIYLTSVFSEIVYLLSEKSELLKSNIKNSTFVNPLSKLSFGTFFTFTPKFPEYSRMEITYENDNQVIFLNESASSDYKNKSVDYQRIKSISQDFTNNFSFFDEFSENYLHQKAETLSYALQSCGIVKADFHLILTMLKNINDDKNREMSQENSKFKEKVLNILFPRDTNKENKFELKQSIKQMMIITKYIDSFIQGFEEKMDNVNVIQYEDIMKFFEKNLFDFFKNNNLNTQNLFRQEIKNYIFVYDDFITILEKRIKVKLSEAIKEISKDRGNFEITINLTSYYLKNQYKTEQSLVLFSQNCGNLIQMIKDGSGYIFCFKSQIKKFFIFWYISDKNFECLGEYNEEPEIAFGSTFESLIIVNNSLKSIEILEDNQSTYYKQTYENNSIITHPNYVKKFKSLLYLNSTKDVKCFNFSKSIVTTLKVPGSAVSLRISDNQDIIGVVYSESTVFFNIKLEKIYEIPSSFPNFYIISKSETSFNVLQYFNNSITITEANKPKEKKYDLKPEIKEICEDVAFILSIPLTTAKTFKIFSKIKEKSEKTFQFFNDFKEIYPNHKIMILDDFSETYLLPGISTALMKNRYFLLANVEHSNVIPIFKSPLTMIQELKTSKIDLFRTILSLSNFQEIEKITEKMPSLKVICLLSDEKFLQKFNSVFNNTYRVNYSAGIWASINVLNYDYFLCLYSIFPNDLVELQKVLSYFYNISDFLLIAPDLQTESKIILKCLKLAKIRFPEIKRSSERVDILLMNNNPEILEYQGLNVSTFSKERISDEMEFLLKSFTLIKTRRPALEVLNLIKALLVSLYLDDDINIFDRLEGRPNDVELMKTIIRKDDIILLESFQINKKKNSLRCKAVCPGCSAMCELSNCNGEKPHFTRLHRVFKNKYALEKDSDISFTCHFLCVGGHSHFEPCVGVCKMNEQFKGKWKHRDQGKTFDLTLIEYAHDKIECSAWWAYRGWRLENLP